MSQKLIRIRGIKYRCRLCFTSAAGLDPLAEFFYDKVLQGEPRVDRLLSSFGLPSRVIEDILIELLAKNYALLNISEGRIKRLERPRQRRERHLGDSIEVWQDDVTGTLLPVELIQRFANKHPHRALPTLSLADSDIKRIDFIDAPDARIISSLRTVAPAIMSASARSGFILDSLVDRDPVPGGLDIYLDIDEMSVDGESVEFIRGPNLPHWLTRAWTLYYHEQGSFHSPDEASIARAQRQKDRRQARNNSALRECQIRTHIERWQQVFTETLSRPLYRYEGDEGDELEQPYRPDFVDTVGELTAPFRALQDQLELAGAARLASAQRASHLDDLVATAETSLVIVVRVATPELVQYMTDCMNDRDTSGIDFIIIHGSRQLARDPSDELFDGGDDSGLMVFATNSRLSCEAAILDGREVRFGDSDQLLRPEPLVTIASQTAAAAMVSATLQNIQFGEGGLWLSRRLEKPEPIRLDDDPARIDLIEKLLHLQESAQQAQQTYWEELQQAEAAATGVADASSEKSKELERALAEARRRTLEVVDKTLETQAFELREGLYALFERDVSPIVPMPGVGLVGLLIEAVELLEEQRGDELVLVASQFDEELLQAGLLNMMTQAMKDGMFIRIYLSGHPASEPRAATSDDASLDVLRRLATAMGEYPRFRVASCRESLPAAVIVNSSIVLLAGCPRFDSRGKGLTLAMEAPGLAHSLREQLSAKSAELTFP